MNEIQSWVVPDTNITTLLKFRPRALELLENHAIAPWALPNTGISEILRSVGVAWPDFLSELKHLPVPKANTDWNQERICYLLDYLYHEHKKFACVRIPAIEHALAFNASSNFMDSHYLHEISSEWKNFANALEEHMREEEDLLFPEILRNDAGLRYCHVDSSFSAEMIGAFLATQGRRSENRIHEALSRISKILWYNEAVSPGGASAKFGVLLRSFVLELEKHAQLENKFLFPRSLTTEKNLLGIRIDENRRKSYVPENSMVETSFSISQ